MAQWTCPHCLRDIDHALPSGVEPFLDLDQTAAILSCSRINLKDFFRYHPEIPKRYVTDRDLGRKRVLYASEVRYISLMRLKRITDDGFLKALRYADDFNEEDYPSINFKLAPPEPDYQARRDTQKLRRDGLSYAEARRVVNRRRREAAETGSNEGGGNARSNEGEQG